MKKTSGGGCSYVLDANGQKQDNPYKNDKPLGNVLIIQESNKACQDDSASGGTIKFEFCQPVAVRMAELLDVDDGPVETNPTITVFYSDGTTNVHRADSTGDNGVWRSDLEEFDVVKVEVWFHSSGSISVLDYFVCPTISATASPTKAPTASPTKAPTAPPTKAPTVPPTAAPTTGSTPPPVDDGICPGMYYMDMACYKCGQKLDCLINDTQMALSDAEMKEIVSMLKYDDKFCGPDEQTVSGQQNCQSVEFAFLSEGSCCMPPPIMGDSNACPIRGQGMLSSSSLLHCAVPIPYPSFDMCHLHTLSHKLRLFIPTREIS
jgi:hypothetical protein